ncbi:MAG TPA: HEAT repeat domain-containing protein [Xanthomonadales bacterium]|nr:HEAT repeat domain-containing protein [Xanthomonadales bacterium]
MNRCYRSTVVALMFAWIGGHADSAELKLPADGWASWRVPAVAGAPDWCCFGDRADQRRVCDLDARHGSYGTNSDDAPADHTIIYARFKAGQLQRLRAYGPTCHVQTTSAVAELGDVDVDISARWLATQLAAGDGHGSDLLAALATHAGAVARGELVHIAGHDGVRENRKDALFWLAQVGDAQVESTIRAALKAEPSREVRHHAVFALSLLPDERGVKALIGLLEDRSLSLEDRKQALFWLGQSEHATAQAYLAQVLAAK